MKHLAIWAGLAARAALAALAALAIGALGCGTSPRSARSFDQIRDLVAGKTESEVELLLGHPDLRQPLLADDERWVWWNYTFLDGNQYAPELRRQVIHLEITFSNPGDSREDTPPPARWRVRGPLAVSFSRPTGKEG
jgi:hypothetical protein